MNTTNQKYYTFTTNPNRISSRQELSLGGRQLPTLCSVKLNDPFLLLNYIYLSLVSGFLRGGVLNFIPSLPHPTWQFLNIECLKFQLPPQDGITLSGPEFSHVWTEGGWLPPLTSSTNYVVTHMTPAPGEFSAANPPIWSAIESSIF